MEHPSPSRTTAREIAIRWGLPAACLVLVAALALAVEYKQLTHTWMLHEKRAELKRYLDGTVDRPLAFRVLVPQTIRLVERLTPDRVANGVEARAEPIGRRILPMDLPAEPRRLDYYVLILIQLLSLLGYALLGHRLYCRLFPRTAFHCLVPAGFLALLIPFIAAGFGHIYDFTVLFFAAALLWAMATDRQGLYLLLFAVACFNKETTIFVTVGYACYFIDRMPRGKLICMLAGQVILFLAIYLGTRHYFSANGGENTVFMLPKQFDWLTERTFPEYLGFLLVLFLITFRFGDKPLLLRRTIWMTIANAVVFVCGANLGEWRNFYETLPVPTLLVIRNLGLLSALCFGRSGTKSELT